MQKTQITTLVELEADNLVGARVAGVELVVTGGEEGVQVFGGYCPHQGTLLSEGSVEAGRLTCRGHGWQFDTATGQKVDDPQTCLRRFAAGVEGETVWVDADEVAAWAAARQKRMEPAGEGISRDRPVRTPDQLPGPAGLPLLGNLLQIQVEKFHQILEGWYREYGDIFQIRLGRQQVVVIADVEMVQEILQQRPEHFSRLETVRQTISEMGVIGLFSAEGEQWRRHRQLTTRAFDVRHLRDFFPVLVKVTQRLHGRWKLLAEQQLPFNVQEELMRYTVDVTSNLAFGYDMNTLKEEGDRIQQQLEHIFPMIARRTFMPVRYWNVFKLPADRALDASIVELQGAVEQLIDHARRQMDDDPALMIRPQNMLQALLAAQTAAQADEEVEFSDHEIYGNVLTFLIAGEDTTANTMAWMLYYMTKYPEVQQQMQAEADAVLAAGETIEDYDKSRQLRYIEAVAHETLRFKPVGPFIGLQALKEVTVGDLRIPEGSSLLLLLRPKALEEGEFAAAGAFKPERWLDYAPQDNPHQRKSYSPFGGGPRLCPGRSLALLEIKMAMSMICHHFDVARAEPGREIAERFVFTVTPENLLMTLHPRNQ